MKNKKPKFVKNNKIVNTITGEVWLVDQVHTRNKEYLLIDIDNGVPAINQFEYVDNHFRIWEVKDVWKDL